VAVESKCTEHLGEHAAQFSEVYDDRVPKLATPSWQAEFEALKREPSRYTFLNAAQLVKHYLGMKNTFGGRSSTLLYLYWEPANADEHAELLQHRAEVDTFAGAVSDPAVRFVAMGYPQLWEQWASRGQPNWLGEHVAALRRRYLVTI
jgi:hypothetical protein